MRSWRSCRLDKEKGAPKNNGLSIAQGEAKKHLVPSQAHHSMQNKAFPIIPSFRRQMQPW
jgi:hypothetical protein